MTFNWTQVAAVAVFGVSLGCAAVAPRSVHATEVGLVRADDEPTVERFAELLETLHPLVRATLPDSLDRPTEVWVQTILRRSRFGEQRSDAMGFTILGPNLEPGRIHLRADSKHPSWYLAHELVHGLMGPSWAPLPGILTEGLCDALAARVTPGKRAVIRTHRALHAGLYFGDTTYQLDYTLPSTGDERQAEVRCKYGSEPAQHSADDLLARSRWDFHKLEAVPATYYGAGFVFVERILERVGIDGLHGLCLRATREGHAVVPSEWLMDAAGFEALDDWSAAVGGLLGEQETRQIAQTLPAIFGNLAVHILADRFGDMSLDALFERVNPRLRLDDGAVIPLRSLAGVRAQLSSRWPGPTQQVSALTR